LKRGIIIYKFGQVVPAATGGNNPRRLAVKTQPFCGIVIGDKNYNVINNINQNVQVECHCHIMSYFFFYQIIN